MRAHARADRHIVRSGEEQHSPGTRDADFVLVNDRSLELRFEQIRFCSHVQRTFWMPVVGSAFDANGVGALNAIDNNSPFFSFEKGRPCIPLGAWHSRAAMATFPSRHRNVPRSNISSVGAGIS